MTTIIEVLKTIFVILIMLCATIFTWWITMPKKHKEVLGGPMMATKRILKYGFTGEIDREAEQSFLNTNKDKASGE